MNLTFVILADKYSKCIYLLIFSLFLINEYGLLHLQNSNPNTKIFEKILEDNPEVFHKTRTAKSIHNHWLLMKHYQLLSDQTCMVTFHTTLCSNLPNQAIFHSSENRVVKLAKLPCHNMGRKKAS